MCRLVAWVSQTPRTLHEVLGPVALERLRHLSTVHADGWGAAWHDDDGALVHQHSPTRAGADDAFSAFAEGLASRACLVHLRLGTPGYGHGRLSTHPFVEGDWAFGHNGAIMPPPAIDEILDPASRRTPHGPTDSERYFVGLRDAMDQHDGSVTEAMGDLVARIDAAGLDASSLNALLLGPDAVHVISRHDPAWQVRDIPVWPAELAASAPAYFPMSYRADTTSVTAVSSGIVDPSDAWRPIPNDAVLRMDTASPTATIEPLGSPRRDRGVAPPEMFA
jgi:predicted glutamine amidotransferase